MNKFNWGSDLEITFSNLKAYGVSIEEISKKLNISRNKINNIRRLNNFVEKEWLNTEIHTNFKEMVQLSEGRRDHSNDDNERYVKYLEEENKRLKEQVDMLLKKLLDSIQSI